MPVTYKNNRLVPAVLIATCVMLFYYLFDPSIENYGQVIVTKKPIVFTTENADLRKANEEKLPVEVSRPPPSKETIITVTPTSKGIVGSEEPVKTIKQTKPAPSAHQEPISYNGLSSDDVILIMKTGGTTLWKRLLIHLTTSLAQERIAHGNTVIYSDLADRIGDFTVIDALANMTDEAKARPDFDVYRQQPEYTAHNFYVEASGVEGDEWGPTGGWIIDKYKFVPLVQHAGQNWPRAKWYIYMEDDAYLFLPNVLAYLSQFDASKPHYLGSYAAKTDVIFAHGGAGFALSRGAWEQSFGRDESIVNDYYQYTADHCCGDQVLAHALRKHGVKFGENGGDGKFTWGFNPVVHWAFAFSQHNWCKPLLSWHKVHSRDVAQYYELEKSWDFSKVCLA